MTITLTVPNEQLFEKILWLLNRFKNDGVNIVTSRENSSKQKSHDLRLKQFEQIVNTKSKNSIKLNNSTIFNPHSELTNDIS